MKISVNIPDAVLRGEIEKAFSKVPGAPVIHSEIATLTKLDTRSSKVSNLTGLEFATSLERLYLRGTTVSDLTPLANLMNLETLDLRGTDILDLTPLANLTELRSLYLSSTISEIKAKSSTVFRIDLKEIVSKVQEKFRQTMLQIAKESGLTDKDLAEFAKSMSEMGNAVEVEAKQENVGNKEKKETVETAEEYTSDISPLGSCKKYVLLF